MEPDWFRFRDAACLPESVAREISEGLCEADASASGGTGADPLGECVSASVCHAQVAAVGSGGCWRIAPFSLFWSIRVAEVSGYCAAVRTRLVPQPPLYIRVASRPGIPGMRLLRNENVPRAVLQRMYG